MSHFRFHRIANSQKHLDMHLKDEDDELSAKFRTKFGVLTRRLAARQH
jgi:hypothetical protein